MDIRVTQFGSETEPDGYDLHDQHSSDSSFDRRMLQHMTRQRLTRRDPIDRRLGGAPLTQFDRRPRAVLQENRDGLSDDNNMASRSSKSQRQRRRLNRPLEDFNRNGPERIKQQEAAREAEANGMASEDIGSASHSLFQRYQKVKNASTPIVRDSDPNVWDLGPDDAMPTVEDSPLSRKSVGRGTPGTAQSSKTRALEKVLSWNMSDDFDENSIIASTPAHLGKRLTLAEVKQAELDASVPRNSLLKPRQNNDYTQQQWSAISHKAHLQAMKVAQAQAERARFSRPLSRDGELSQLPNPRTLDLAKSDDEVFMTLPDTPNQGAVLGSSRQRQNSASPGRKENVPPPDHQSPAADSKTSSGRIVQPDKLSGGITSPLQSELKLSISIFEDPPTEDENQAAGERTDNDRTSRKRRGRATESAATKVSPTPGRSRAAADDSIDVLRRLSRSVSGTPVPQKSHPKIDANERIDDVRSPLKPRLFHPQMHDEENIVPTTTRPVIDAQATHGSEIVGNNDEQLVAKTPRVTGAWIETPLASNRFQATSKSKVVASSSAGEVVQLSSIKASKRTAQQRDVLDSTALTLPTSALSSVVETAKGPSKRAHSDDDMGESTIHSLEELMGSAEENNDLWDAHADPEMISEEDRTAIIELLEAKISNELPYSNGLPASSQERRLIRDIVEQRMNRGLSKQKRKTEESDETSTSLNRDASGPRSPMTPRRKDRLLEELQLQRMSEHVNSMHTRTRSLSKGLGRIERKLADTATCTNTSCDGNCYASHPVSAYSRLITSSLYRTVGDQCHLTRLGWALIVSSIWAVGELILWSLTSDPIFASYSDTDYGPFRAGPSPPFLLLSKVWQPFTGPVGYFADIATAFWSRILGLIVTIFGDDIVLDGVGKTSQMLASSTTRAVFQSIVTPDADFSMERDEVVGWVN